MKIVDGKVVEDSVSEVGRSANVQLAASVERNKKFNEQLAAGRIGKHFPEIDTSNISPDVSMKLAKIEMVLKDKGMDSQQRHQALEQIREILDW